MSSCFVEVKREGLARRGRLLLAHGTVETPVFMPVGTYGAVKGMAPRDLIAVDTQILLGNTYHLYLRPGLETLGQFGGLHPFMGWDRPILTDSGGFQVFSLSEGSRFTDEGVTFRSHLNGDRVHLTPELSAQIQHTIGSDIAMVLDHCPPLPSPAPLLREAVKRSAAWAQRFLSVPRHQNQRVFGILQGGTDPQLRQESLELTLPLAIDGLAVGGLSVGEPHELMIATLEYLAEKLPPTLPHYLMGVGTPLDILEAVRLGIDMFDCVLPTRNGRNGGFFTHDGLINIRNARYQRDPSPVDPECACETCAQFSRAYLRHLFQTQEMLGCRLATTHNLHYYHRFMSDIRQALESNGFTSFYHTMKPRLAAGYGKEP